MRLPVVSGDDVIKALRKAGFEITRQRGSHVSLLSILKQARMSREELLELL